MGLTVDTFFRYYIFHPLKAKNEEEQRVALITSVVLGILSVGIIHIVCSFFSMSNRKIQLSTTPSEREAAVGNVFQRHASWNPDHIRRDNQRTIEKLVEETVKRESAYQLGLRFKKGEGVEKSSKNAYEEFHKAAKLGHLEAQLEVGEMYRTGKGVRSNDKKARYWLNKAADQGNKAAKRRLALMGRRSCHL